MRLSTDLPTLRLPALLAVAIVTSMALSGCKEPQPEDSSTLFTKIAADKLEFDRALIESRLKSIEAGLVVESISPTPLNGIVEVVLNNGQIVYTSLDGSYVLNGKLFHLSDKGLIDLSAEKLREKAYRTLQSVNPGDMIIYPAKETKTHITVFTDVDCPYCQKLHDEVSALTDQGVEVRYLAFPRQGIESETAARMASIWCAENRQQALDAALKQEAIDRLACENPISSQYDLGHKLGVTGTPAIVLADGTMKPGYSPAKDLLEAALAAEKAKN